MIELALQAKGLPRQWRNHYSSRPSQASVTTNNSNTTSNGIDPPSDDGGIDL
jgi:hypothetical protein